MPDPVFVLGAPRSGTTLLRVMLAGHPGLFVPPEMVIAPFTTMAERRARLTERFWEKGGLRRAIMELEQCEVDAAKHTEQLLDGYTVPEVYRWLQDRLGSRLLVDKCPHLSADPAALRRLAAWYPGARWIWIHRHPGSVTRSIENMPMAEVMLQGYAPDASSIWYHSNQNIRSFLSTIPAEHQVRVGYEDLVVDARPSMVQVCLLLGLPFDEKMLDPYEGDRMREGPPGARAVGDPNMAGRGKVDPSLATKWLDGFDPASVSAETHTLARELGYDLGAMAPPPLSRVRAGFAALLDTTTRLEAGITMPADLDALEGRRFVLRMLAASVDLYLENGDVDRPAFAPAEGPTRKMFADNPDADYWRAPISFADGRTYRVWGRIPPGTVYVGVLLYGKGGRCANRMVDTQFVGADGCFDLTLGAREVQPGGVGEGTLRGDGDETAVMVRQYFTDRTRQAPVELHVERLTGPPAASPLEAEGLVRALDRARRNLEGVVRRTVETHRMASQAALNRFLSLGGEQLFPTPDNTYLACWYRFGEDQRMYVRGRLPKARYFSVCLYNVWLESLDYTRHRVCLNHTQIQAGADGTFEICLSHSDPGHPNWLDTTGHAAGYLLARALLAEEDIPVPVVEVRYHREVGG